MLVSAIQQHESAIEVYRCPFFSWTSLPAITFLKELKYISPDYFFFFELTLRRIASVQETQCSYLRYEIIYYLTTLANEAC